MIPFVRLRDSDSDAPEGLRDVLRSAEATRSMTDDEKRRFREHIVRISAPRAPVSEQRVSIPNPFPRQAVVLGFASVFLGVTLMLALHQRSLPGRLEMNVAADPNAVESVSTNDRPTARTNSVQPSRWNESTSASANRRHSAPSATILDRPDAPTKDLTDPFRPSADPEPNHAPARDFEVEPSAKIASADFVMLDQVRRDLQAKNPIAALSRLDQHARSFPSSPIATQREILAMDALAELGRFAEARSRGEALLEVTQGSPDEARVRHKLNQLPSKMNEMVAANSRAFEAIIAPFDDHFFVDSPDSSALVWLHGTGNDRFDHFIRLPANLDTYRAVIVGDFNGDGRNDMARISADEQSVWLGTEDDGFTAADAEVVMDDDDVAQNDDDDTSTRLRFVQDDDDLVSRAFSTDRNAQKNLGSSSLR